METVPTTHTLGTVCFAELVSPSPDTALQFYGDLFGWTADEIPGAGGYRVIKNGEHSNGGIMAIDPRMGSVPPNWLPYFGHEDVERLVDEVVGLGGQVRTGPVKVPAGTFIVLADPQGAAFAALSSDAYDA
jgi:predicted enzyme related to lactoylglutathione lyase